MLIWSVRVCTIKLNEVQGNQNLFTPLPRLVPFNNIQRMRTLGWKENTYSVI